MKNSIILHYIGVQNDNDDIKTQLISESYNNSRNRVKITPQGGVTIFGVNITPKRSNFLL